MPWNIQRTRQPNRFHLLPHVLAILQERHGPFTAAECAFLLYLGHQGLVHHEQLRRVRRRLDQLVHEGAMSCFVDPHGQTRYAWRPEAVVPTPAPAPRAPDRRVLEDVRRRAPLYLPVLIPPRRGIQSFTPQAPEGDRPDANRS